MSIAWTFWMFRFGMENITSPKKGTLPENEQRGFSPENQCVELMSHIFSGIGFLLLDSGSVIQEKNRGTPHDLLGNLPTTKSLRVRGKKSA